MEKQKRLTGPRLFDFTDKFTDEIELKLGNSSKFMCNICKKTFRKEEGVKWDADFYICRECYLSMDKSSFELK